MDLEEDTQYIIKLIYTCIKRKYQQRKINSRNKNENTNQVLWMNNNIGTVETL